MQRGLESTPADVCVDQPSGPFLMNPTTHSSKAEAERENPSIWRESQLTTEVSHNTQLTSRLPSDSTGKVRNLLHTFVK